MIPETEGERRLVIRRGNSRATFSAPLQPAIMLPPKSSIACVADFNGDQRADIVIQHERRKLQIVYSERAALRAGPEVVLKRDAFSVAAAALNRDGRPDLVIATANNQAEPSAFRGLLESAGIHPVRTATRTSSAFMDHSNVKLPIG